MPCPLTYEVLSTLRHIAKKISSRKIYNPPKGACRDSASLRHLLVQRKKANLPLHLDVLCVLKISSPCQQYKPLQYYIIRILYNKSLEQLRPLPSLVLSLLYQMSLGVVPALSPGHLPY